MCRKGGLVGKERWDETEEGWTGKIGWIRLKAIEGGMDNFIVAGIWKTGQKKWYVSWRSDGTEKGGWTRGNEMKTGMIGWIIGEGMENTGEVVWILGCLVFELQAGWIIGGGIEQKMWGSS